MSKFAVLLNPMITLKNWQAGMSKLTFSHNMQSEVRLTEPRDGHILVYDDEIRKWVNISQNPSLEEQFTGRYTSDGKKIYWKEVNFGNLPNATTKNVAHNIDGTITAEKVWGRAVTGALTLPLPHANTTLNQNVVLYRDGVNVVIITAINLSAYTAKVWLDYTRG